MSTPLLDYIRDDLALSYWRPFSWFMDVALYHPDGGYYARPISPFGRQGDFFTAPGISSLFVHAVARQVFALMAQLNCYSFCEIGPGSGVFCQAFLSYAAACGVHLDHYYLCERTAARRSEQLHVLAEHPHVDWVTWVESVPADFEGVIFANEVMDALPVSLAIWDHHIWQRGVSWGKEGLMFVDHPLSDDPRLYDIAMHLPPASMPDEWPYQSELLSAQSEMVCTVMRALKRGWFLVVDYGFPQKVFYHPDRRMGTLMCHYHHQAHTDPLLYVGEQDLTAHVDFTACASAALSCGAQLEGFVSQEAFLINMGILEELMEAQADADTQGRVELLQAFHQLTHPAEMGSLCQVMGLSKACDCEAAGFSAFDRTHTL